MSDYPQTKQELIARITQARDNLESVLKGLDAGALDQPGKDGGWSVKDHLAHLSEWARKQIGLIDGKTGYEALGVHPDVYNSGIDHLNAALYERNKARSLEHVLADFRATHAQMIRRIQSMEDADLQRENNLHDIEDKRTLVEGIASNTYEHDEEHAGWIKAMFQ